MYELGISSQDTRVQVTCQSLIYDDKEKQGVAENETDITRRESTNEILSYYPCVFPGNPVQDLNSNGEIGTVQHMVSGKRLKKSWSLVNLVGFPFDFKKQKWLLQSILH